MSDQFADLPLGGRSGRLDKVLSDLLSHAPELEAAAVVSFDGLPMASALPGDMDEDRVAAMSAALLSLGERAAEGLGRGALTQVYVEGENGTVYLISADDEAVLVAVAAKGAKAGLMLFEVRRAAAAVAEALRADDAAEDAAQATLAAAEAVTGATTLPPLAYIAPQVAPYVPAHAPPEAPAQQLPADDSAPEPYVVPSTNSWGPYGSLPLDAPPAEQQSW